MRRQRLGWVLLLFTAFSAGCSDDTGDELIQTAEFEERQHNLVHAKQLYEDVLRLYPTSSAAETARARLARLNQGQ